MKRIILELPKKQESAGSIMTAANHAAFNKKAKARGVRVSNVESGEPLPVVPATPTRISQWTTPAQRTDALAKRLLGPRK